MHFMTVSGFIVLLRMNMVIIYSVLVLVKTVSGVIAWFGMKYFGNLITKTLLT